MYLLLASLLIRLPLFMKQISEHRLERDTAIVEVFGQLGYIYMVLEFQIRQSALPIPMQCLRDPEIWTILHTVSGRAFS